MQFYIREKKQGVVYLYYDVTDGQFNCIVNHQYKSFPIRFFTQRFFCPTFSLEYATRIAEERNNWINSNTEFVHILRFVVRSDFIKKYAQGPLDNHRTKIVIPYSDLIKLNQQLVGYIERIGIVKLT